MKTPKYDNSNNAFLKDFNSEIAIYFRENNKTKYAGRKQVVKSIFFFLFVPTIYVWLIFFSGENTALQLTLCALIGIGFAGLGFNVMHDGSHNSAFKNKKLNWLAAHTLELMGNSTPNWIVKHVTRHHSYVNTYADEDVSYYPLMRTLPSLHKRKWFHRYQHIYGPLLLYPQLYWSWVYIMDFIKYFRGKVHGHKVKYTLADHIIFWSSKIVYSTIYLAIPIMIFGLWPALIGYAVMSFVCGFTISMVFQLAHVVESSTFPEVDQETGLIQVSWAESQVRESSDFATGDSIFSKVLSWFVGGLNYQTIHHLRPDIAHEHYGDISKILDKVSKRHGIVYNKLSFWESIFSHFRKLKQLGVK